MRSKRRSRVSSSPKESDIQRAVLAALKLRRDVVVWRNNTGTMKQTYRGRERLIRFGLDGQADITGLIKPWGTRLEIEVKRPGGRLTDHQQSFAGMVRSAGGVYFVAHSIDKALIELDASIRQLKDIYK